MFPGLRQDTLDHGVVQGGMGIRGFELRVRGTAGGVYEVYACFRGRC